MKEADFWLARELSRIRVRGLGCGRVQGSGFKGLVWFVNISSYHD